MISQLTILLLFAALTHFSIFVFNRWLLCIADGPLKVPIHVIWLLGTIPVPCLLLVAFRHWPPLQAALAWQPDSDLSRLLWGVNSALIAFWVARSIVWFQERHLSPPPRALLSEQVTLPTIPPIPSELPKFLQRFETTGALQVVEREIAVSGLAPAFDGFRIVQVADVHFGQNLETENYLAAIVELVRGLDADLVALTGDFADTRRDIARSVEYHSQFRGRLGTVAVLGNHDYWVRPDRLLEQLAPSPIRWLGGGERRVLRRGGRRLVFVGTDAPWNGRRPRWSELIRRSTGDAIVLLSHTPDNAPAAARAGASLILSGHNHGGQICLPLVGPLIVPSRYGLRYAGGTYMVGADSVLHVSRGVGASTQGIRILCPPEINVLTLRAPVVDVMVGQVITGREVFQRREASGWEGEAGRVG
jgi:predicted MPP superfamily phosphohydrolase